MAGKFLVYSTRNRETGVKIDLYDSKHPDNEAQGLFHNGEKRWVIFCTDHETQRDFDKQTEAYPAMTRPTEWCPGCQAMKAEGKVAERAPRESAQRKLANTIKVGMGNGERHTATLAEVSHAIDVGRGYIPPTAESLAGKDFVDMKETELRIANKCGRCGEVLKANDGHYHSTGFPIRPICCSCAGCPGTISLRR